VRTRLRHDAPAVRERTVPTLKHIGMLTLATVIGYILTGLIMPAPADLTGALTALLVVQASAFSTVKMGLVRVGAVLTGIVVAIGVSTLAGLTWWSLGLAVALSLLFGWLFRLGEQALETPISAMLILGVSNHSIAAESRMLTTLIGAATGVAIALAVPRSVPSQTAARKVRLVAESTADALALASRSLLAGRDDRREIRRWLAAADRAEDLLPAARAITDQVNERRVLNPRALTTTSVEPVLRTGIDTLEASLDAVRQLFIAMLRRAEYLDADGDDVRAAFGEVLEWLARSIDGFGALVQAEAERREDEVEEVLAASLESLQEARAFLTELVLARSRDDESAWLLHGSVLGAVEQVLDQLDLEERSRLRRQLREDAEPLVQLPLDLHLDLHRTWPAVWSPLWIPVTADVAAEVAGSSLPAQRQHSLSDGDHQDDDDYLDAKKTLRHFTG